MHNVKLFAAVALVSLGGTATGQPMLTPDRSVDTPIASSAAWNQDEVSVAFGAGVFVAVWLDRPPGVSPRLFASRLDASGGAMDDPAIIVDATLGPHQTPAIAFDGSRFVIAWVRQDPSGLDNIEIRTLSPSGTLGTEMTPFPIGMATENQKPPIVAGGRDSTGNDRALVVWEGNDGILRGEMLLAGAHQGSLVWPASADYRNMADPAAREVSPAAAFGADHFLVGWLDTDPNNGFDLFAAMINSSGVSPTAAQIFQLTTTPGDSHEVSVGFGADKFLASWRNFGPGGYDIYARFIDAPTGTPDASDFLVDTANGDDGSPQVSFASGNFAVVWQRQLFPGQPQLLGNQVSPAGTVLQTTAVNIGPANLRADFPVIPADAWRPSVLASDGTNFILGWTRGEITGSFYDAVSTKVMGSNLSSAAMLGQLSRGPNAESEVALASNGTEYLAVWADTRNFLAEGVDLYGMRMDANGNNVEMNSFAIATGANDQGQIAVAAIPGGDFLVVWTDRLDDPASGMGDIRAARVSAAGIVLDPGGITLAQGSAQQNSPSVAGSGDGWIVVWAQNPTSASSIQRVGVTANGSPGTPSSIAGGGTVAVDHPSIAFDGTRFLVAFESRTGAAPKAIAGTWLDGSGSPTGVMPSIASSSTDVLDTPAVAAASGRTLVVWHQPGSVTGGEAIYGRVLASNEMTPSGAIFPIADMTGSRGNPRATMLGNFGAVGWADGRDVAVGIAAYAMRLSIADRSASILDMPNGFSLGAAASQPSSPAAAPAILDNGAAGYAFVADTTAQPDTLPRAHVRFGGVRLLGTACTLDSNCDSDHCSNGVCCESTCNGTCQQCGGDGRCNLAPKDDATCGASECTGLATECVDYIANARCEAFGVCRLLGDPAACMPMPKAEGSACVAVGCTMMGGCVSGACVCGAFQPGPSAAGVSPEFANPGCSVGGRGSGLGFWIALGAMLAVLVRRRFAGVLALLFFGCTSDPGGLIVQVDLTGQGAKVDHVRFILKPTSAQGFPMTASSGGEPSGVTVLAADADGDGVVDEVIDVDKAYISGNTLSVEITPRSGGAFGASVRAWAIDATGNRFAETEASSVTVKPGETPTVHLALACRNPSCGPTAAPLPITVGFGDTTPAPAAVAAGRFRTGATVDIAVGIPGAPPGGGMVAMGEVRFILRPTEGSPVVTQPFTTLEPGDRFGTALATGDLDGSGIDSLVVGAPGAHSNDGGVYILKGDGSNPPMMATMPDHQGQMAEQLGSALAVADVDGDGRLDIIAGAPFGKNVYVFRAVGATLMLHDDGTTGFGSAVAASKDGILVGAPESNRVRFYEVSGGTANLAFEWNGTAGAFGAAVALADVDGDGRADLIAAAPLEGSGVVYVLRASERAGSAASVGTASSAALRAVGPQAQIGLQLAVLRGPRLFGDQIALAAPGNQVNAFLIEGSTIVAQPYMAVDDPMAPIAARVSFTDVSGAVPLAVADLDGDGAPDWVTATPQNIQIVKGVAW